MSAKIDRRMTKSELISYRGVVFPFMESLSLDCHRFYIFLMILKETLTFLSLLNSAPQRLISLNI